MKRPAAVMQKPVRNHRTPDTQALGGPHVTGSSGAPSLFRVHQLKKSYRKGKLQIPVLRQVDLSVREGEFLAIVGQSGSGKSTLLHLMGTLDVPDAGEVHFSGQRIDNLPSRKKEQLRNREIGLIFQFYHLLPELTALENVMSPRLIAESAWGYWRRRGQHKQAAMDLLKQMRLDHRATHRPNELSGGEMQRAAIARSLVFSPRVLLADEPTGNLDRQTGQEIMDLLRGLNEDRGLTIVMVTHDQQIAVQADRTVRLVEGQMESA